MNTRDDDQELAKLEPAPTEQELKEAQALRQALEGSGDHPDAQLAQALRAAWNPKPIDEAWNEALIRRAISRRPVRSRVAYVVFGSVALAAAAAFALVLSRDALDVRSVDLPSAEAASLIRSRTTQDLFDAPFPRHGGNSERVDRIAGCRTRDYRQNLFARMGVR